MTRALSIPAANRPSPPRHLAPGPSARPRAGSGSRAVLAFASLQFFALIYLQKLSIPVGSNEVAVTLVSLAVGTGYFFARGQLLVCPRRLVLYLLLLAACLVSQIGAPEVSWTSFVLLAGLNGMFVFVRPATRETQRAIIERFERLMVAPALLVFAQKLAQVAGLGDVLNLEKIVPARFLLTGYIYSAEFGWGTGVIRPNGFFFLEPSYASGYLAAAAIAELFTIGRRRRVAFFVAACLATSGGTGMLMLAVAGLWLIPRFGLLRSAALAAVVVAAMTALSWSKGNDVGSALRLDELSSENSSGYGRLVLPLVSLAEIGSDVGSLLSGSGAGSITEDYGAAWPLLKVAYEYSTLSALCYGGLIALGVSRPIAPPQMTALLVVYQLTGGYLLQPAWVGLVVLCCSMFVVEAGRPEGSDREASDAF